MSSGHKKINRKIRAVAPVAPFHLDNNILFPCRVGKNWPWLPKHKKTFFNPWLHINRDFFAPCKRGELSHYIIFVRSSHFIENTDYVPCLISGTVCDGSFLIYHISLIEYDYFKTSYSYVVPEIPEINSARDFDYSKNPIKVKLKGLDKYRIYDGLHKFCHAGNFIEYIDFKFPITRISSDDRTDFGLDYAELDYRCHMFDQKIEKIQKAFCVLTTYLEHYNSIHVMIKIPLRKKDMNKRDSYSCDYYRVDTKNCPNTFEIQRIIIDFLKDICFYEKLYGAIVRYPLESNRYNGLSDVLDRTSVQDRFPFFQSENLTNIQIVEIMDRLKSDSQRALEKALVEVKRFYR